MLRTRSATVLYLTIFCSSIILLQFGSFQRFFFLFSHFYSPSSGQAVVTGVVPFPPGSRLQFFVAHRVQQSRCSSNFRCVLLTHALALSASQFVHKKNFQRIYTSMHSAGLEITKLTYTRLEDNLIRHRGDRSRCIRSGVRSSIKRKSCKNSSNTLGVLD